MAHADGDEENWIARQREAVEEYLGREEVDHLTIEDRPEFHVQPYVALWIIRSKKAPRRIGWWVISGDLPTDRIDGGEARNPREALRAFSRQWYDLSGHMLRGEEHPHLKVGTPDRWPELGDLLIYFQEMSRRATKFWKAGRHSWPPPPIMAARKGRPTHPPA
jgi:hypothetical protein